MLEALLPQAAQYADTVEVVVSDNASTDNTRNVVDESRRLGNLSYFCMEYNKGSYVNIVHSATKLAKGKYVWMLGSHNLLMPGALGYVLDTLAREDQCSVFYVNFRCASYPNQWPVGAAGGYDGCYEYQNDPDVVDRGVACWHELIKAETALCTQQYAHIVNRSVWVSYWEGRTLEPIYSNGISTYPHTYMIAESLFNDPAYYIGKPLLTIFNGAQTWNDTDNQFKVYSLGLSDLLSLFQSQGLSDRQYCAAKRWVSGSIYYHTQKLLSQGGEIPWRLFVYALSKNILVPHFSASLWKAFIDSECSLFSKMIVRLRRQREGVFQYLFYNSRPARWYRRAKKGHK